MEEVLSFLQYLGDKGLSHATVEMYAAAVWYAEMTQMLAAQPWSIPQVWGALAQEVGSIGVLPMLGQPLRAWLLRGIG